MTDGGRVLIVEDEPAMRRFVAAALSPYEICEASSIAEARSVADANPPRLIVLALDLPDGDGLDLLRELRMQSTIPIVALSGRQDVETAHTMALEAGADDYLVRSCGAGELRSCIATVLSARDAVVVTAGPLRVDLERDEIALDGRMVDLTPLERRLVRALARRPGTVTYRQLLEQVWGTTSPIQPEIVRTHVAALRRKLEKEPLRPRVLVAVLGVGYRLRRD